MLNIDYINDINRTIKNNFDSQTITSNKFPLNYHYQNYQLIISLIKTDDLLFTCNNSINYFANIIDYSSLCNFNPKFSEFQNISQLYEYLIKIINENILSIKVFQEINILLLCLTDKITSDTIFQFYLKLLNKETINNDLNKMSFKNKERINLENNVSLNLYNSKDTYLQSFNELYSTNIIGNEKVLDLSFIDANKTKNKPNKKINEKGLEILFLHKFKELNTLWLSNNEIIDLTVFQKYKTKNLITFWIIRKKYN